VIVLDLGLPDMDGMEVCERLRRADCRAPIVMLTARDGVEARVQGLDRGADDYLAKPFEFAELFARLRALTRRGSLPHQPLRVCGELVIDPAARRVTRRDAQIDLTAKEFSILEYLALHRGAVLSREQLVEAVWDDSYQGDSNVVDVYVRRLREKIDRPFGRSSLETVRGVGYRLVGEDDGSFA
jgi:DNA-binding response OmpR family regulator